MSDQAALQELVALLEEKNKRLSRNKLQTYYPEKGPLRRELYPKHMDFFRAGGLGIRERCIMAANRVGKCTTFSTQIETSKGIRTVGDLYLSGEPFFVTAWDGHRKVQARAFPPFRKSGLHECYRFTLSDGRWFEAADEHLVRCADASWRQLRQLFAEAALCLPGTSLESARSDCGAGCLS